MKQATITTAPRAKTIAIDMGMTWQSAQHIIAAALRDGTATGRAAAKIELSNMARAADLAKDLGDTLRELVELKAIKRRIDSREATPAERVQYKQRKVPAWVKAEQLLAKVKS